MERSSSWHMLAAALLRHAVPLIVRAVLAGLLIAAGVLGTLPQDVVNQCRDVLVGPLGLFVS